MEEIYNINLKQLPRIIEKIIENELGEKAEQLKHYINLNSKNLDTIKKLEKENKKLNNFCKDKEFLIKGFELLAKDGILEFEEDGDTWCDEYGNGGGFHQIIFKYKGEVIYEEGQSF